VAPRLPGREEPTDHRVLLTGEGIFSNWLNTLAYLGVKASTAGYVNTKGLKD
jgi:hypothetical protein